VTYEGVDYADSHPSIASLLSGGKTFVIRYGGPGRPQKQLQAAELADLQAAGIAVVANAEGVSDGLRNGWTAGVDWAQSADTYFKALGMPADRPIYLSVDFSPVAADWDNLDAAMDGAASVLGRDRVGVYGGYATIAHFFGNKKASWFWQTYAWSGGIWHNGAHIRQYRNGVTIGGADCDLDRAMVTDIGQWTGDKMTDSDGAIAEQYRVYALLTLDPKWANDSHITLAGRMPSVPAIDLLKRLDSQTTATGTGLGTVTNQITALTTTINALSASMNTVLAQLKAIQDQLNAEGQTTGTLHVSGDLTVS
jgi:Domain of unknown function (DUF1906)